MSGKHIFINASNFFIHEICTAYKGYAYYRVLAFSIAPLKVVEIQLDNGIWQKCDHIKGPLYVSSWNSTLYIKGIHQIQVQYTFLLFN